ncbi:MAG: Fe-S cluster assembly protein SufD [Bacteroidia bacterium]|nr:Fe-S cluster assembly protein SufD [Bacteroidia bacterium]
MENKLEIQTEMEATNLGWSPSIRQLKNDSKNIFQSKGYPATSNEEYKYLPIQKLTKAINQEKLIASTSDFSLPINLDAYVVFIENGQFRKDLSTLNGLPENVLVDTFTNAFSVLPELAEKVGKLADISDGFVAKNTAEFDNGICIFIPNNLQLNKPIYLVHFFSGSSSGCVYWRNLVVLGEQSSAELVSHTYDANLNAPVLLNTVSEFSVAKNARLDISSLQETGSLLSEVNYSIGKIHSSGLINHFAFCLSGSLIRNNTQFLLHGENANCNMFGVFLPTTGETIDNHTLVDHRVPNCQSNELYKGVASGKGTGVFNGKIFVRKDAQKTNAFQSNKNLLLSDDSAIYTKPQLEIYADDVKCSHGSSTGQLDEKALFYLQTRGIGLEAARKLLVTAFAQEILNEVGNSTLKEYLELAIENKLSTF